MTKWVHAKCKSTGCPVLVTHIARPGVKVAPIDKYCAYHWMRRTSHVPGQLPGIPYKQ